MRMFLSTRLLGFAACVALLVLSCVEMRWDGNWVWGALVFGTLAVVGVFDLAQRRRAVSRNYPVLAHIRYFLESIGPEIRQYFIERDTEENPFSRLQRSIVYQRAKGARDTRPFGTQIDVYSIDHEWINHSVCPAEIDSHDFRIVIGPDRAQPYSASVFNISAMSFGSLSGNAIRALNGGAKMGNFYHDTGEGSISVHHRANGGDLTWEVASGYFGCRNPDGTFSEEKFIAAARDPQVKMIEIKLSQGAKPGHGGVLPAAKVSAEIAQARGVPQGVDCISPAKHSAFSTPIGLLQFVERLRELSGGKPTGFKLAIGHPWEWFGIAKAMQKTGILPDFIVVDGGEGGHRRGACGIHRPRWRAAARGIAAGAQHSGWTEPAWKHQDRRSRQDHQRLRTRAHPRARRRLGKCRARFHVRDRLHPVAKLPHRSLPDRRRNAGSATAEGAGRRHQGDAGVPFPPEYVASIEGTAGCRRPESSGGTRPRAHHQPRFTDRSALVLSAVQLPRTWFPVVGSPRACGVRRVLGCGERRSVRASEQGRGTAWQQAVVGIVLNCPDAVQPLPGLNLAASRSVCATLDRTAPTAYSSRPSGVLIGRLAQR